MYELSRKHKAKGKKDHDILHLGKEVSFRKLKHKAGKKDDKW